MARSIVFRADASPEMGLGHLRRCLTLADAFAGRGWSVGIAATANSFRLVPSARRYKTCELAGDENGEADAMRLVWPEGISVCLVDHYGRDAFSERHMRGWAQLVVALDDVPRRPHDVDALVDYTPGRHTAAYAGLVPPGARKFLGAQYVPVRREVRESAKASNRNLPARRTVVTFGGTDPDDLTARAVSALASSQLDGMQADIVAGSGYRGAAKLPGSLAARAKLHVDPENFPALLAGADLALAGSGTTCWELAFLGVPALLATNSPGDVVAVMEEVGAGRVMGHEKDVTADVMAGMWHELAGDSASLAAMSLAGRKLIDGAGAGRIAAAIEEIAP